MADLTGWWATKSDLLASFPLRSVPWFCLLLLTVFEMKQGVWKKKRMVNYKCV